MDSAIVCFTDSYKQRLQGMKTESVPDILINLADACSRQGKYDVSAFWYRKALQIGDSLGISEGRRHPVYYGLAQVYMALHDFDQCDYYYNLAGMFYDKMLPYEKYIYLNNRGNSYYYREDYPEALKYFKKGFSLAVSHPDMGFEKNLCMVNLGDVYLQMNEPDSAAKYINECQPFFRKIGAAGALYYIDTQRIGLALGRNDMATVRNLLSKATNPNHIEPDMLHIRNKYLQEFYEKTADYKNAFFYQKENSRLDDSIRNEHVRMRTADMSLRYQQDSTLLAKNILIEQQKVEMLKLHEGRFFWIGVCVLVLVIACFIYLYEKKRRALLLAQSQRTISSLRLENIRNRMSPHFIFNVLNQEMGSRDGENKKELSSLVKLMRRNLELAEQMCVTLKEELGFVQTYIDLQRRSLGPEFKVTIEVGEDVDTNQLLLPSMLIQIPVENAIKHALQGKEGERRLWIDVLVFNPYTAWDGNATELSSLLKIDKEEAAEMKSNFSYQVEEVTRFVAGELTQEIFDQVCGKDVPYVGLIGNHDCLGTGEETFRIVFGDPNFSFIAGRIKFVCLNTNAFIEFFVSRGTYSLYLPESTSNTFISLGDTPGIRLA